MKHLLIASITVRAVSEYYHEFPFINPSIFLRAVGESLSCQLPCKTAMPTPAEANTIQHNFVKPYMATGGKTPVQAAGIHVEGWKDLLQKAVLSRVRQP